MGTIQTHPYKKTCCQFEENCLKITTMRVPHRKTYKMTVMTSSKQKFEKMKKCHLKFLLRSFECIFIKIGRKLWKIFIWTHRQTDAQTGLILRVKIFGPEMTEYKNVKKPDL